MKHLIARTLTFLVLAVAGLAVTAPAQSTSAIKLVRANIPFEFSLGDKTFPAGDYSLAQPMQHFLELRDSRGKVVAHACIVGIDPSTPLATTKLRFYVSGDQHILAEVWREEDSLGQRLCQAKPATTLTSPLVQSKFAKHGKEASRNRLPASQNRDE